MFNFVLLLHNLVSPCCHCDAPRLPYLDSFPAPGEACIADGNNSTACADVVTAEAAEAAEAGILCINQNG